MRIVSWAGVIVAAGGILGCQTITEEMPARPSPVAFIAPIPVVIVPIPIPTVAPPPAPAPNPSPNPAPPAPAPEPGGPDIPDNTNPVAKLTAKVYFIECQGQVVNVDPVPVGCRIHLDVTPTDQNNKHTRARGTPVWTYSNPSIIRVGGSPPYNPTLDARAPGDLSMYCEVDGVRSNTVSVSIR